VEAKQEMEDDPWANEPEGGAGDEPSAQDGEDEKADLKAGGRPTQAQRDAYDRAFADVHERIAQCAAEVRVSYGGALKAFYTEERTGLRPGRNSWNLYQCFANYNDANRLRERQRLDPAYPSEKPIPSLKADELSRAYKAFVACAGGEDEADGILSIFFQMGGTADDTIQARRRRFHNAGKMYEKLVRIFT
jgi:hypothetical protein